MVTDGDVNAEPTRHEAVVIMADKVGAEGDLRKRKREMQASPISLATCVAWRALTRTGDITTLDLEAFEAACFDVNVRDDGAKLDPTRAEASSDSASISPSLPPAESVTTD